MIFIANALPLNGGTTFLIRMCRELTARGRRPAVLVIFNKFDSIMRTELEKHADIFCLSDFSSRFFTIFFRNQVGSFLPLNFHRLDKILSEYGRDVHVMGIFGLLFAARLIKYCSNTPKVSVGIYHQNEFMFCGVNAYFAKMAQKMFASLDPRNVIFYNESSRDSYAQFFDKNYKKSSLLPVGVSLPDNMGACGLSNSRKIVSIGNLYNFKTYNRHVINCMPFLLSIDSRFIYEIYGEGPCKHALETLGRSLGVADAVLFKGEIAYEDISKVLADAWVFVGSGTAIVEASALGVPSIIGIESSVEPVTYGLFNAAVGFSYHESVAGRRTILIKDVFESVLENDAWRAASVSCQNKAKEFSVKHTADGFLALTDLDFFTNYLLFEKYSNIKSFFSLVLLFLKESLLRKAIFRERRNQGTVL